MRRASEVDAAIVGESARWGHARRATPFKREVEWLAEQRWLRDTYWKANHPQALQRFKNVALYPVVVAPAFTQHGGRVERSFEFSITAPAGTVYFTLDGRDPRLPSGAVSPAALVADEGEPLAVEEAMTVKARALQGSTWSPLTEAYFFPDIPLRITEVMYHPAPPAEPGFPADDYEFIELQNIGDTTLELGGIRLAGAVEFDFSRGAVSSLAPGKMLVVVKYVDAFAERYDARRIAIAGNYQGELRNSSERVLLLGPAGEPLHDFRYSDLWYPETDGEGYSLVIREVLGDPASWTDPAGWRPSGAFGGSPGIDESGGPRPDGLQGSGDLNQDGELNLSDPVSLLTHLFIDARAATLPCGAEMTEGGNTALLDANGDNTVDLTDAVHLLSYLFLGGPGHALGTGCRPVEDCPDGCGG